MPWKSSNDKLNTKLHTFPSWGVAVFELRADELGTGVGTVTVCHQNSCTGNWLKCAWVILPIVVSENTWSVRQSRWFHKWVRVSNCTRTQNHLVRKQTLHHSAKLQSQCQTTNQSRVSVKQQIKLWSNIFFILFHLKCTIKKNKMLLRPLRN